MTPLLSIGRFAQLTEMTVRALRFYAELELLVPEHVDDHSGYRYYATNQLERAELIAQLRRTMMSLEEIGKYLESPSSDRLQIIAGHRDRLRERAAATADAMRILDRLARPATPPPVHATPMMGMTLWDQPVLRITAEWTEQDVKDYDVVFNTADGVGVVLPTCDLVADKGFIEETYAALERQGLEAVTPPYFTCSEPTEDGIWRTEVGWPVDRPGQSEGRVEAAVLPGCDVARTVYKGRFEDIAFAYRHLWTEITAAGYMPIGNPREVYVTEPDGRAAEDYYTEVLWPISRTATGA